MAICSSWIKGDEEVEGVEVIEAIVASLAIALVEAISFRY